MRRRVPLKKRFGFKFRRDGERFFMRVCCGVFLVVVSRRWDAPDYLYRRESKFTIGWIPWKVEEGSIVPTWTPYKRTSDKVQMDVHGFRE